MKDSNVVKCAWCDSEGQPIVSKISVERGGVVVRRCEHCDGILASYFDEDRIVLENVRTFIS